ncbi:MAG TPA: acylneuraminate cytidylyltransferase family protein [Azospirillum sp.]|nr:acylneuraminate cytidylyltransferase family protein [Azospirillum sp.]
MIKGQPLTAVIPVRGGSKGIPGKNLHRLGRDTLLERTIKLAQRCPYIDRVVVTTDHPEMYAIAQRYGVAAPTLRPAELATDTAKTVDVVLQVIESVPVKVGYIVLLQVTSPLRTLADLNGLCEAFEKAEPGARSIVSLVRHDSPHPDKIQKIAEDGFVASYLGKESMVARQSLPEVYSLNGAFYLTHRDVLIGERSFMPTAGTLPFVMPPERSANLDNMMDLQILEALLEKGILTIEEYD